jgi:hypothetical protein
MKQELPDTIRARVTKSYSRTWVDGNAKTKTAKNDFSADEYIRKSIHNKVVAERDMMRSALMKVRAALRDNPDIRIENRSLPAEFELLAMVNSVDDALGERQ